LRDLPLDMLVCDGSIARAWGATLAAGFHKPIAALSVILPDSETDRPMSIPEIVLCPQEFDLPHDRFRSLSSRAPIFYAEPSVCREGTLRGSCAISGMSKEPVIYCTFGTQTYRYANAAAIFNCVIDACIGLPCQVIVSCNDPAALNYGAAYPTNVTVVPSAPQMAILEQARLFISHGGLGGVKESIMNGVPLLVIPFDMDQPRNAERVLYHGLGAICGPSDCTATRLRELIDHVLGDSETPLRVRRMSTIFREREQEASAARIVAGCLLGCDAPTASSERVGS
jgi:MGT family glycosyltransferase